MNEQQVTEGVVNEFIKDTDGNPTGGRSVMVNSTINWQNGIIAGGRNGAFVEDVIDAAIARMEFFNSTKFNCPENTEAIEHLKKAREALDRRTSARKAQGVENSYNTHKTEEEK